MSRHRRPPFGSLLLACALASALLQAAAVQARDDTDGGRESQAGERGDAGRGGEHAVRDSARQEQNRSESRGERHGDALRPETRTAQDAVKAQADAQKDARKLAEDSARERAKAAEDADKEQGKDEHNERKEAVPRSEGALHALERLHIERDAQGLERVPGEVLVVGGAELAGRVRDAGYRVLAEQRLAEREELMLRVALASSRTLEQTLTELRTLLPAAWIAPNHIYRPSASTRAAAPATERGDANAMPIPARGAGNTIGLLDTGADPRSPLLTAALQHMQSFTRNTYTARAHGTLVAELAASRGASLAVADVFAADEDDFLVAPADAMAAALSWLLAQHVAVINISIEGPDNAIMALMIRRAIAAGVVVVAAAGNRGPAAAPAYPAAYPDVIAVTAIDRDGQVYRRANHGSYISFAAPGVNIVSAGHSYDGKPVSGTSFAAPQIAALAAEQLLVPSGDSLPAATRVMAQLRRQARDLGVAGFDPIYGWGVPEAATAGADSYR